MHKERESNRSNSQVNSFKEKFDESIDYLRLMLRKNKKNYDAWTLLGVSYFHTGLPKRSLKILKYAENKANNKPYNHYYQGLCYDALGKKRLSIKYFKMVAASSSPYADPAAFELSASYYNMKKKYEAEKWLNFYLGKFSSGRYRKKAIKMKRNLARGKMSPKVSGIKKPNLEKAYSNIAASHLWIIQTFGTLKQAVNTSMKQVLSPVKTSVTKHHKTKFMP